MRSPRLQLGVTLKRVEDPHGYVVDLSQPNAHKTSAVFGPSRTTVSAAVVKWIDAYLGLWSDEARAGAPFVFHKPGDPSAPLSSSDVARACEELAQMRRQGIRESLIVETLALLGRGVLPREGARDPLRRLGQD